LVLGHPGLATCHRGEIPEGKRKKEGKQMKRHEKRKGSHDRRGRGGWQGAKRIANKGEHITPKAEGVPINNLELAYNPSAGKAPHQ